jgi:hypothetical protein
MSIILFYAQPVWDSVAGALDTVWLASTGWIHEVIQGA